MARYESGPLTTAEAKERLRVAAREVGPAHWFRENRGKALAFGMAAGMLLGSTPRLRRTVMRAAMAAAPLLIQRFF